MNDKWSTEEILQMLKMFLDGSTAKEIGDELGRSEKSIWHKAMREGFSISKFNRQKINELNDYERGFIEGALDADGSITLSKGSSKRKHFSTPSIVVVFSNNNREWLLKIQKILGKKVALTHKKGTKNFDMKYTSWNAYWILKQIRLIVKEPRRLIAIEIFDTVQEHGGGGTNQHTCDDEYKNKINELVELFYTS